jgi:hypothetical protein
MRKTNLYDVPQDNGSRWRANKFHKKTSFALRIVAKNCPLGHRIKCFSSALDVKIRKVYSLLYYFAVPVGNTTTINNFL